MIRAALDDRYAEQVTSTWTTVGGLPGAKVEVRARVPALGLFGPSVAVAVSGHAIREVEP
jgi:hypothetical protein